MDLLESSPLCKSKRSRSQRTSQATYVQSAFQSVALIEEVLAQPASVTMSVQSQKELYCKMQEQMQYTLIYIKSSSFGILGMGKAW